MHADKPYATDRKDGALAASTVWPREPGVRQARPDPRRRRRRCAASAASPRSTWTHVEIQRGSHHRADRPQRRRQDHVLQPAHRVRHRRRRQVDVQRPRMNGVPAHKVARRGMVRTFQLTKALSKLTVLENMRLGAQDQRGERFCAALVPSLWRAPGGRDHRAGRGAAPALQARRQARRLRRQRCPAASASCWRWPARSWSSRELVMLDEPMAGVNPALTQSLLGHVKDLREQGMTVLFVEHDMDMVRDISDWVIVMAQGTVIAEGPPDDDHVRRPRHRRLPGRPPRRAAVGRGAGAAARTRPRRSCEAEARPRTERAESEREGARSRSTEAPRRRRAGRRATRPQPTPTWRAPRTRVLRCDELIAGYLPGRQHPQRLPTSTSARASWSASSAPTAPASRPCSSPCSGWSTIRSGSVTLKGEDITNMKAHALVARGVGYVPQTNNVFPSLTIEENLEMGAFQAPKKFKERFEFVAELFPALKERRKQRAGSLSGGERQMVAMARALMTEPSVLLLDEPSAGLSPKLQDQVFIQAQQINRAGVTVIMVEQNARRCLQICDRGYVLDQGRNAYTGDRPRPDQRPQGDRALSRHPRQGLEDSRTAKGLPCEPLRRVFNERSETSCVHRAPAARSSSAASSPPPRPGTYSTGRDAAQDDPLRARGRPRSATRASAETEGPGGPPEASRTRCAAASRRCAASRCQFGARLPQRWVRPCAPSIHHRGPVPGRCAARRAAGGAAEAATGSPRAEITAALPQHMSRRARSQRGTGPLRCAVVPVVSRTDQPAMLPVR